jgi:putative peptidoglycan lipid II flippase
MAERLLRATATVGGMTLISRVTGLVRDIVLAVVFGAGAATDAFFVAFKAPNFLRRLFAEGAFSQAFVPVLAEYRARDGGTSQKELIAAVAGTLAGVLLLLSLAGVAAAPLLIWVLAPGFSADAAKFDLTASLLRITFPYLFFISLTALAASVLNSLKQFAIPAFTPVFLNLSLIAAALVAAPWFTQPVMALAAGVFVAGVVQLAFQLPALARAGLLPRPRWDWQHPGVRRIRQLMLPALFGASVVQVNLLFDTAVASFLAVGSVSWLYYAERLVDFPLGVFGVALGTVLLPSLSQQHAESDPRRFALLLDWALRWTVLVALPAATGLLLLAAPLLAALFQHGAFDAQQTRYASWALMAMALGLPGFIFVKVLAPGFYARQDTRSPVRAGIAAMLANMVLTAVLVGGFVLHFGRDTPGGHALLALSTALSAYLNAGLLYRWLRRGGVCQPQPGWPALLARVLLACGLMALVLWQAQVLWPIAGAGWLRLLQLLGFVALGAGVFTAAALLLGLRPAHLRRG